MDKIQNLISYRISITLNRGSCPLKMDKSQKSLKHFLNEKGKTNIQQKKNSRSTRFDLLKMSSRETNLKKKNCQIRKERKICLNN